MSSGSTTAQCKYDWYQSDGSVSITILKRGLSADDCRAVYNADNKKLNVLWKDETIFSTVLNQPVDSVNISITCTPSKVEVTLKKLSNIRWVSLSCDGSNAEQSSKVVNPKSSEWERLAKEAEKEEQESSTGVEKLFQSIYRDADDDVKKAMMKSFTESCGTVLSTNWNDIKQKRTDVKPPDDMEFKKYEI